MNTSKAITLHLEPDEYERLEAKAGQRGLQASTLARGYIRTGLAHDTELPREETRRLAARSLSSLARLRSELRAAGYPSIDAVELVQSSRDELTYSSIPPLSFRPERESSSAEWRNLA